MLSQWVGLRGCFLASGILTLFSAVIALAVMESRVRRDEARPSVWQDVKRAASTPTLMRVYGLILLVSTSVLILEPLLAIFVVDLGGNPEQATLSSGIVFSAIGVATMIMGPRWGKIGGRIGFGKTLTIGLIGGGIGNLLQAVVPELISFGALRFGYGLLFAAVYPSLNALIVQYAEEDFRGRAVSLSQSATQLGVVFGPLFGGVLGDWMDIRIVFVLTGAALLAAVYPARKIITSP